MKLNFNSTRREIIKLKKSGVMKKQRITKKKKEREREIIV
jgi:hypothetical protein